MIRNQHAGLGDLYNEQSAQFSQVMNPHAEWATLAFGVSVTGRSWTQPRQEQWRDRIIALYDRLLAARTISADDHAMAREGARLGLLFLPSIAKYPGNRPAQAAVRRINETSGLSQLRHDLLIDMQGSAAEEGAELATEAAQLDVVVQGMYYISGLAVLDKLNTTWDQIVQRSREAQGVLQQARLELDAEGFQRVQAELSLIDGEVDKLSSYVSTEEAPRLGAANLVLIGIIGVALAMCLLALAYIVQRLTAARNIYAQEAARMLRLKTENAQADYDLTSESIQSEYDEGLISAEERDARMSFALGERDGTISAANQEYQDKQKALPGTGMGGLSLGLGAIAAVGLVALVLVMRK